MKKQAIILFAAAILPCTATNAQQRAGSFAITPKVGISISNFTGSMPAVCNYAVIPPTTESGMSTGLNYFVGAIGFDKNKSKVGFTAGVEAQYQFSNTFGLSLGVMYAQQGARYNSSGATANFGDNNEGIITVKDDLNANLHTIVVPVLVNAYVWRGLAIKAGLQPEFIVSKKMDGDISMSYQGNMSATSNMDIDYMHSFALSLPIGFSYEYKNIVADCRYHIGLTDMKESADAGKNFSDNKSSRNSMLTFTLGYKFEL